jgi:hypothetical protein
VQEIHENTTLANKELILRDSKIEPPMLSHNDLTLWIQAIGHPFDTKINDSASNYPTERAHTFSSDKKKNHLLCSITIAETN